MEFTPDGQEAQDVPFFKDTMGQSKKGWAGHTTSKSIEKLQSEIKEAISLLGGTVTGFMKGIFAEIIQETDTSSLYYAIA